MPAFYRRAISMKKLACECGKTYTLDEFESRDAIRCHVCAKTLQVANATQPAYEKFSNQLGRASGPNNAQEFRQSAKTEFSWRIRLARQIQDKQLHTLFVALAGIGFAWYLYYHPPTFEKPAIIRLLYPKREPRFDQSSIDNLNKATDEIRKKAHRLPLPDPVDK